MSGIVNLVQNPSFETAGAGGADVFANWDEQTTAPSTIVRSAIDPHSGTYCALLTSTLEGSSALLSQTIPITSGKYILIFNHKTTDLTNAISVYVQKENISGDVMAFETFWDAVTWKQETLSFTVPSGVTNLFLLFDVGPFAVVCSLDDILLYRIEPVEYSVLVDWNRDNIFEADEADRLVSARIERGREGLFGSVGQGVNRGWIGNLTVELNNEDGRFDPLNTGSPLYPNVLPNCEIIVQALLAGVTPVYLFRGHVTDIRGYGAVGDRKARLTASDGWYWAANTAITTVPALQTGQLTSALVDAILSAAGWNAYDRVLNAGGDVLDRWWMLGSISDNGVFVAQDAMTALLDLVEATAGTFFFDGQGRAVYRPRTYEYQRVASATYTESNLDEALVPAPWDTVRNRVRQTVTPVTVLLDPQEVWSHQELPLLVAAGASVNLIVPVSYAGRDVAITAALTPVAVTDFRANSQADGSGDDETANVSITVSDVKPTHMSATLTNSAAHDVYFTEARIRAYVIDAPVTSIVEASDSASITRYGEQVANLTNRWQQSSTVAASVVAWYLYRGKNVTGLITIRTKGEGGLRRDVCDRIHLDLSATVGPHGDYLIGKVTHDIRAKRLVETTLTLEAADDRDFFLVDTDSVGGAAILGY